MGTLSTLLKAREDELKVYRQTSTAQQQKLADIENENKAGIAKLYQTIHDKSAQNDQVVDALQRKEAEARALMEERNTLQRTLEEQNHQFGTLHEQLRRSLSHVECEKRKLTEGAQSERKLLDAEIVELKKHCAELEHVVEDQKQVGFERDALEIEIGELKAIIQSQGDREAQLRSALEQMTERLKESQSERDILVMATKNELKEVSLLKQQCDELEQVLHFKHKKRRQLKLSLTANTKMEQLHVDEAKSKAETILIESKQDADLQPSERHSPSSMKQQMQELSKQMASQQHKIAVLQHQERQMRAGERSMRRKDDVSGKQK